MVEVFLALYNVRTLSSGRKIDTYLVVTANIKADVIGICETRSSSDLVAEWHMGDQVFLDNAFDCRTRNGGAGFIVRKESEHGSHHRLLRSKLMLNVKHENAILKKGCPPRRNLNADISSNLMETIEFLINCTNIDKDYEQFVANILKAADLASEEILPTRKKRIRHTTMGRANGETIRPAMEAEITRRDILAFGGLALSEAAAARQVERVDYIESKELENKLDNFGPEITVTSTAELSASNSNSGVD
uniref:Endo/exonuclease/phosphatase domain-containing protein n=1 Tax=Ascaris lumbricoides TaxID=6252 RepID=A0A0M3IEP0_ASCLU